MDTTNDYFHLFRYYPNLSAAIFFVILFGAISVHHSWALITTRTWFFTAFTLGCWFECVGFIFRTLAAKESPNWTIPTYSVHTILVLIAPSVFAASIYMCLGRIVLITNGEKHSLVSRRWLTRVFVIGDVISFIMQGAGGGVMASGTLSALTLGENIIIAGLSVQILFFSCFVVVGAVFHSRMYRRPTRAALDPESPWRSSLYSLYAGSILIWVRCVFRLIEYAQGNDGYLISHEVFLYVFDAMLMFGVMILFAVFHPSRLNAEVRGSGAIYIEKVVVRRSHQRGPRNV